MLGNLKQQLGGGLASYKKVIFIILLAAVFIVTAVYVYKKHISDKNSSQPKKQTCASGESKSADLYLFYTEWCPHCKKTKPEWEQLKKNYSGNNNVNGYKLNFIEVDCDANPEIADKFKVEGYPTIKLVKGNQIVEFDAKPDVKTLEQFLSTVLND
jgi:thiol-disulfide isomerase/thioredoxin